MHSKREERNKVYMEYVANVWVVGRFDVYCLMMMGLHVFDELFSVSCS